MPSRPPLPRRDELMAAEIRREGSLADGMIITGSVRAKLLGMRILELDADVAVSPTPPRMTVRRPEVEGRAGERERRRRASRELAAGNGAIGGGLDAAARALEVSVGELAAARRRMP